MPRNKIADPYRKLTIIMVVLLLLLVSLGTAYVLLDKHYKGEHQRLQQTIDQENAKIIEEHNHKVADYQQKRSEKEVLEWPTPAESGWDVVDVSAFHVEGGRSITVNRLDALAGGLLLINRWHELPADFVHAEELLKSIGETTNFRVPVTNRSVSMFPNAITALEDFIKAAKADGQENYIVRRAYRTMATQTEYWNKELQQHPNQTGEALEELARKAVSKPGSSDYQSGFSFEMGLYSREDSVINDSNIQKTEQGKYLNENCWKYGLIFRFPSINYPYDDTVDKSYITGLNPSLKMNAYRYVGIPHSTVMHIKGFCLEEYIDFLIANPHIMVYQDGTPKYEIFRVPETYQEQTLDIPANASDYSISTDNMGGLVCAITY